MHVFPDELAMKLPCKVFGPTPIPLIKSLHFAGKKHGLSEADLYRMDADLIEIPSITAMSKQEVLFLVDSISRQTV